MRRVVAFAVAVVAVVGWPGVGAEQDLGAFELAEVVDKAKALAALQPDPPQLFQAGRFDYLAVTAGIFEFFERQQRPRNHACAGAVIDPVLEREHQYSTPCFAHVGATLLRAGWYDDHGERKAKVLAAVELALDRCLADLVERPEAGPVTNYANFYSGPAGLAIRSLEGISRPEKHEAWRSLFPKVDPKHNIRASSLNWLIVAASGEQVRLNLGLNHNQSSSYIEYAFQQTEDRWGINGEFLDRSGCDRTCNPTAYDHFSRYFLTVMIANGLDAPHHLERIRRAAWLSMLMQSAWGESPTGGRSAQHQWNEAQMCATFEFWASEYAKQGDETSAKIFKRAAALALGSVRRWRRDTGDLYIIKNRAAIAKRHGYEYYSQHSQYNLIAASMLSSAFDFANDTIREGASFAETGGFAFQTAALSKVFANAGGMYVEVELLPDEQRDTLGLTRVHTTAADPRLSVTAGVWRRRNPGAVGVGVVWGLHKSPSLNSLANVRFRDVNATATLQHVPGNDRAEFSIQYAVPDARVHESYTVTPSEVRVQAHLFPSQGREVAQFGVSFPAFASDGKRKAKVVTSGPTSDGEVHAAAEVTIPGDVYVPDKRSCVRFEVLSAPPPACVLSKGWVWDLEPKRLYSRNGFANALYVKCAVSRVLGSALARDLAVEYRIRPCRSFTETARRKPPTTSPAASPTPRSIPGEPVPPTSSPEQLGNILPAPSNTLPAPAQPSTAPAPSSTAPTPCSTAPASNTAPTQPNTAPAPCSTAPTQPNTTPAPAPTRLQHQAVQSQQAAQPQHQAAQPQHQAAQPQHNPARLQHNAAQSQQEANHNPAQPRPPAAPARPPTRDQRERAGRQEQSGPGGTSFLGQPRQGLQGEGAWSFPRGALAVVLGTGLVVLSVFVGVFRRRPRGPAFHLVPTNPW